MRRPIAVAGKFSLKLTVAGSCLLTLFVLQGSAAGAAVTFNRAGAINFANRYWNSYPSTTYSEFIPFGEDCTNFISYDWQLGGGTGQNSQWFDQGVFFLVRNYSNSWSVAANFVSYQTQTHMQNGIHYASLFARQSLNHNLAGSVGGDAIAYNWADGQSFGVEHLAMDVGGFTYPSGYYDPVTNFTYYVSGVYTGVDQHTTNRQAAPWNIGWLQQYYYYGNYVNAQGMWAEVVHINT